MIEIFLTYIKSKYNLKVKKCTFKSFPFQAAVNIPLDFNMQITVLELYVSLVQMV